MSNIETRRERFVRIAERRVNNILNNLDSLGKCANRKNYHYGDEDVRHIFGELEKKMKETKLLFKNSNKRKNRFRLQP
jgi:hypothetical protein